MGTDDGCFNSKATRAKRAFAVMTLIGAFVFIVALLTAPALLVSGPIEETVCFVLL